MADKYQIQPAAEFANLPLETLISAPLTGAVKAQVASASATLQFVELLMDKDKDGNKTPTVTTFRTKVALSEPAPTATDPQAVASKVQDVQITVPYLALLPVPNLCIDKVSSEFEFAISQTLQEEKKVDATVSLDVGVKAPVSWLVNASLKGNLTRSSSSNAEVRRSATLKIAVQASQAPMTEGLKRVLTLLSDSILVAKTP